MAVRIGYACISVPLREKKVYTTRTLTLHSLNTRGAEAAIELSKKNIADLLTTLEYNERAGIRFFRITSHLFPHAGNPLAEQYSLEFAREGLAAVGVYAREHGHRLTMHPGQFAQLGSPHTDVVAQTLHELDIHAWIFRALRMEPRHGSVMIIHGGGVYGNKDATLKRVEDQILKMPSETRQYLSLENDEWHYSVMDLLPVCERVGVPLTIDFFHHEIGHADQFDIYDPSLLRRVVATWTARGIKPKCHWSNQSKNQRKGAHSEYITRVPEKLLAFAREYDVDIMAECKMKDLCALRLLKKYFTRVNNSGRTEWYLR